MNFLFVHISVISKVPFKRNAWGLRPKSHIILIEIKIEVRYLKKNSQIPQEKNRENENQSNVDMGLFGQQPRDF